MNDDEEGAGSELDAAANHAKDMRDPPPELLMPLLPYQKQFLAWALKQVRAGGFSDS